MTVTDKPTYEELENQLKQLKVELENYRNPASKSIDLNDEIDFHDLFDIQEIQKIQDLFAEATGVASIITHPNGTPITKPSNFCRLCSEIIRKTEKGLKNCYYSDAMIGQQNMNGAICQPCLSGGLWDGGASISVGGKHVANWLIGQVKNENIDENKILLYAKEIGADETEFKKALDEVTVMSIEKFKKITEILFFFANDISQKAYQNILQNRLIEVLQQKEAQLTEAKEKAEKSQQQNQSLFEILPIGLALAKISGELVYVNNAYTEIIGYNKDETLKLTYWDITPEKYAEQEQEQLISLKTTGFYGPYEKEYRHKSGELIPVRLTGRIVKIDDADFIWSSIENISEKRQRENELLKAQDIVKESERTFRKLFEDSADAILLIDSSGLFSECNQAALDLLKMTREQLLRMSPVDISPEYQPNGRASLEAAKEMIELAYKKTRNRFDWTHVDSKGSEFIVEVSLMPIVVNGRTMLHTTWRDITMRKHTELLLQEKSEEIAKQNKELNQANQELLIAKKKAEEREIQLKYSQKVASIGYYLFNILANSWTSSEMLDEIFGIDENYVRDINGWLNLIHPDHQQEMREYLSVNILQNHETFNKSYQIINKKSNRPCWVQGHGTLEFDGNGNLLKMFGTIQDISISKKYEQELKDAIEVAEMFNANVTAIIEGTTNSIWAFNRDYEIIYINQVFRKEFFETFGVMLEPGVSLINALPEPLRPFWKPRYDRVLANEQFVVEDVIDTAMGNIYIQVSFNSIIKNGEVVGGSCFGSNITPRKLAELELIKAKEKAEESDRLKSAFLANMSHEIRTPMNGILGFSELLKEPGLTGEEQKEYIEIIEKSGKRMLNIINDIVDISKIEAGLMKVQLKETNINDQIDYVYTFFKPEADSKGLKLSCKKLLHEKSPIIKTDGEKVYAILINMVKNAIKYTPNGSIEFGCNLIVDQTSQKLEFYVKDTGIGIPKDRQEAIFERFIQADILDTMARQGAGLGLSISKAYVEMLGGKIWLESEEGKGATFYFTLPYNAESMIELIDWQSEPSMENENVEKLKILIAEDDEVSQKLIEKYIKIYAKEILKARTGIEAVEVCRKHPDLDLILMDVQMPILGGYEATRQIREFNKTVVIIAQTAFALSGDREKSLHSGCNDYITKPINKEKLRQLIQNIFGK